MIYDEESDRHVHISFEQVDVGDGMPLLGTVPPYPDLT